MVSCPALNPPREHPAGPWLVALGAGLWGTESAWRIPLNDVFSPNVLVFWEHVILVLCALPLILPRLGELRRVSARALAWLVFSGVAGSAVGAVLFTQALRSGNQTIVNVVLNLQPVLSTTAACLLFGDRLGRMFYPWAALAVVAGMVLVGLTPFTDRSIDAGTGYALLCALAWGMSTVAGRGVMVEMSLLLASGLRVVIGLASMAVIIAWHGEIHSDQLWTAAAAAHPGTTVTQLVLLATLSGGVPLLIYFKGLELTRASTAGYFEMMQTLVAVVITWGFFHASLAGTEVIAALVLIGAVAMVQRAQAQTALPYIEPASAER
ncbi:MAG: DMT family transporter [Deltaproteobacteria bacterium]|nr:MAG: DMT family transporter [Deltaproteobacteria bacterium]TMQ27882.1 MAG: DMT family transporter [Deltaproteobacteria bacterium]